MARDFEKTYERLLERIRTEPQFKSNRKYVEDFISSCDAQGLTVHSKIKYMDKARYISDVVPGKDFREWSKKDVEDVFKRLRSHARPWTVDSYVAFFKSFWRYINGLASSDPAPEAVRWLRHETPETELKKEDLLKRDDVVRMMERTHDPKMKALLAVLCTGARPSEIMSIALDGIHDEGELMKIYVRAKPVKGRKDKLRPIYPGFWVKGDGHKEAIRLWLKFRPAAGKGSMLFDEMNTYALRAAVRRMAERAGIARYDETTGKLTKGRDVWPYLFRHSFGTWAYSSYNSAYARRLMGHAPGSKMEGVYCHLAEEDLEDALLGRKKSEEDPQDIDRMEVAQEVLNIMATMPQYGELVKIAVQRWKDKKGEMQHEVVQ